MNLILEGLNEERNVDEDRWVTMKNNHVLVDNKGNAKSDLMKKKDKGSEPDVKSSKKELEKAKKSGDKQREKVAQKKLDRAEKAEAKKKEKKTKVDSLKAELEKAKKSKDEKRIAVVQKKLKQAMVEEAKQRKIIEAFDMERVEEAVHFDIDPNYKHKYDGIEPKLKSKWDAYKEEFKKIFKETGIKGKLKVMLIPSLDDTDIVDAYVEVSGSRQGQRIYPLPMSDKQIRDAILYAFS